MPKTIVPQIEAVCAVARQLRAVRQSPWQAMYGLPKHSPQALVEALLCAVEVLAWEAGRQAQELARAEQRAAQLEASLWLQMGMRQEEQEEDRLFMEACAAEHFCHPGIPAG